MIIDTHAHYDDEQFSADRDTLFASFKENGVDCIINAAADLDSCEKTLKLTQKYDFVYGVVGIHPSAALDLPDDWESRLLPYFNYNKIVGVGEIGLDYHYLDKNNPQEHKRKQKEVFKAQLKIAKEMGLPVCIHDREAHGDTMEILRSVHPNGVLHCFSGSVEMAHEIVKMGMYIGIGGVCTFKNAKSIIQVIEEIPLDSIVIETDAPYLAPVPFRGKRNNSSLLTFVAERISDVCGIAIQEVYEKTSRNARKLYGISRGIAS